MTDASPAWVIRDETGARIARCKAESREAAIEAFCFPALRPEAYFGPDGGWTCVEEEAL